ncbi:tRNA lysidine(34) synthetase TilS [Shouchella shacheensis]|uniref:tRNA lysidine(34) synthetase TilS n=1 Tax=Shouchella shacheensis TaxID=1649580 RepID=UPI0007402B25|nr:tRNA lysidine(34) synthetase TilS [Shouchella shacheensis]
MRERVKQFILKEELLQKGDTVLVAVSGGPDSMALLHLLAVDLKEEFALTVYAAHANHQLRGEDSTKDAALVRDFCERTGVLLYEAQLDVGACSKEEKVGTQPAARKLRYRFFEATMADASADVIVTGHHGDDEAETVLMKLIRGTTPLTRLGIPVRRPFANGYMSRPLLGERKEAITAYCQKEGVPFRLDASNTSTAYTRNRVRQVIHPFTEKENPHFHHHARRYEVWQNDDNAFLFKQAEEKLPGATIEKMKNSWTVSCAQMKRVDLPLQRRMIHLILNYLYDFSTTHTTSLHIEQVLALMAREGSRELHLPKGAKVFRSYDACVFTSCLEHGAESFRKELLVPGSVVTRLGTIRADFRIHTNELRGSAAVSFDADEVAFPLEVRPRKAGDRIRPLGMNGSKKVNRLFIDHKLARRLREEWPLVVDANNEILWIPYIHSSRLASTRHSTKTTVHLTFDPAPMIQGMY